MQFLEDIKLFILVHHICCIASIFAYSSVHICIYLHISVFPICIVPSFHICCIASFAHRKKLGMHTAYRPRAYSVISHVSCKRHIINKVSYLHHGSKVQTIFNISGTLTTWISVTKTDNHSSISTPCLLIHITTENASLFNTLVTRAALVLLSLSLHSLAVAWWDGSKGGGCPKSQHQRGQRLKAVLN